MMSAPSKEILLVGFGAVGAIYSLILKRSGLARVTAVARSNYEIVNRDGIHFNSQKYGGISGWKPDRLCRSVAEAADRPYEYVVVTTKAIPDLSKTSHMLAPLLSNNYKFSQPTYVLLQNGLNVEVDLYHAIKALAKEPRIIGTALWIGTNLLKPNIVEHNNFDRVTLGSYRYNDYTTTANSPEETALLSDFGKILETGGTTVTIVPEIQRMKFAKNLWNIAFSSFSTLTQYTLPALFRPPPEDPGALYEPFVYPMTADLITTYTIPTIEAIMGELIFLGRTLGFPDTSDGLPSSLAEGTIENVRKLHKVPESAHVPSMLLDVQRSQPIEVEVIFGEVVRMAKERNVAVPRIETLYALLLVIQNQILRKVKAAR